METRSIQLPFCGFYESEASRLIDREIEDAFDYSEGGGLSHVPNETWYKTPYAIDYKAIQLALVKAYVDAFADQYKDETGIDLTPHFEEMTSPREYNFETDRVFVSVPVSVVNALFTESEKDNHVKLAEEIKDNCTSYDGFISFYSNNPGDWLRKPVLTWDHNELKILLEAVLAIHYDPKKRGRGHFDLWDLLERWTCNGGLSNAVWEAIPAKVAEFADIQRDYGKPIDFARWTDTGQAYEDGCDDDDAPLAPLPCKETVTMKL